MRMRSVLAWALALLLAPITVEADPPPANPFPTPPPRVFCFRVTDIEAVPGDDDRFRVQFEMLNWTNQPAAGAYIWLNEGSYAAEGGAPTIVSASVDPDGRGGPPGGQQIGEGNYNVPAHHSGRGRGDIPGYRNDWDTVFVGPTSVYWGDDGSGPAATPIPPRSILTAPNSASQFALVPGLGEDGLGIGDAAIDGGPLPYGAPTQPAPFAAGGQPNPDGSGNVLDGFVLEVDDFHVGDVLSFNWLLADAAGNPIGSVGSGGNTVGNEMGFGVFNVSRITPGAALPPGPFSGNSGFNQDIRSFYSGIYEVPDDLNPGGAAAAEFGVEFGAAILAQPASPSVAAEVPPTVTVTVPDLTTVTPNAEPMPCAVPSPLGDANDSGVINVADLVCQLLVTLWEAAGATGAPPECLAVPLTHIDLNCDSARTVADVVLNTYVVLYEAFPDSVDGNGNLCPDSCDCSEALCDDGNACTVDQCDLTGGCTNTVVTCNDGDPCTFDTCDTNSGCVYAPVGCSGAEGCFILEGAECDDGDACTADDGCLGGTCTGVPVSCDDGNPCTANNCDPSTGCSNPALTNGTSCGAGTEVCIDGECVVPTGCASSAVCPNDACTTYECQPADGFAMNQCVIVSRTQCDDGSPCTDDSCDSATGCVYVDNDAADCDDGSICTLNDHCSGGECMSDPNLCDDGNDCTTDFCDPVTGCWAIALDGVGCDDGSACTSGDTCEVGFCVGTDIVCDDSNLCTVDACDPASGCDFTQSPCEDDDPCTSDACDPATGCDFDPLTGNACDDGDVCTVNDQCQTGTCTGNPLTGCGPGTPTVCAVFGSAGDTVYCPIQVAALDSGLPATAAFQATFSYATSTATFLGVNDGDFCAPSETNCQQTLPWTIPTYQSSLQSGHSVSMNPVDPASWDGAGTVLALNPATPTALLTNAYLESNMLLGDPLVFSLAFQLDQNVDENSPMLVTAGGVSAVSPSIVELAVYFDDAIILTGSGNGSIPVSEPQGVTASESYDFADTFTCPPAHDCAVTFASPGSSGTTSAGPEGTAHAYTPLTDGSGTFSVSVTPSGGGTAVVSNGPAFSVAPPVLMITEPTSATEGETYDFASNFTCPNGYECSVSYATPGVSGSTTAGPEGTTHTAADLTEGSGSFSVIIEATGGGTEFTTNGPAFSVAAATTTASCGTLPAAESLVAFYSFDEGAGTAVADGSNNGYDLSFNSAVWGTRPGGGNALDSGTSRFGSTGANTLTMSVPSELTVSAWINLSAFGSILQSIVGHGVPGGSAQNWAFYVGTNGELVLYTNFPSAVQIITSVTGLVATNQWTHVGAVVDTVAGEARFYIDGALADTQTMTSALTNLDLPLMVGTDAGVPNWFNGSIDDIAIYDEALDAAEMSALTAGCLSEGAEQVPASFELAYELIVPDDVDWDSHGQVTYALDQSAQFATSGFDRIGYLLELDGPAGPQYVWTEMDAFTTNAQNIGVPTDYMVDGPVTNLTVRTNVAGVAEVTQGSGGKLEFWDNCYSPSPTAVQDYDDLPGSADCYGSMQVHNGTDTVWAYNRWSSSGGADDLGIGNSSGPHLDWTAFQNATTYTTRRLRVYVRPGNCFDGVLNGDEHNVDCGGAYCGPCPVEGTGCLAILLADPTAMSGLYTIDPDDAGPMEPVTVQCDMDTDGGGWTVIAEVFDETYSVPPPPVGDGSDGTFAEWAAHSWSSNNSHYQSLDVFDALTDGTTDLLRTNRTVGGAVEREQLIVDFDYDAITNTALLGSCTVLAGPVATCDAAYDWNSTNGDFPFFDGWGQSTSCNTSWATRIYNYHNEVGCASDSGLFRFHGTEPGARPQLIGSYTVSAPYQSIKVRPPVIGITAFSGAFRWADGGHAASCDEYRNPPPGYSYGNQGSGLYWIDPNSTGAFQAYCEMTTDGGGWTLVAESKHQSGAPSTGVMGTLNLDETNVGGTAKLADATINQIAAGRNYLLKCQRGSATTPMTPNRIVSFTTTRDWVSSTDQTQTITGPTVSNVNYLLGASTNTAGTMWANGAQYAIDFGNYPSSNAGWTFYHFNTVDYGPYCGEAHNSGLNVLKVFVR